jgi:hypothetical protein
MFMRYLWGLAIGHTYTWKIQDQESPFYAELEDLVASASPELPSHQHLESGESSGRMISKSANRSDSEGNGGYADVDADGDMEEGEGEGEGDDEGGEGDDEDGDEDDEDGEEDDEDGEEDDEDDDEEWHHHNDEEVIAYDDMYEDWHLG